MNSIQLNDRALLVQLSIRQWTAAKRDKRASRQVTDENSVASGMARVNKDLVRSSELDAIHSMSGAIRNKYYANTLPWGMDGAQILSTGNYLSYMSEFRNDRREWFRLVDEFIKVYPTLRATARGQLGGLYDPNDYPHNDEVRAKFDLDIAVFPVPSTDFRVSLASDELTRIQQDVEARLRVAQANAMRDAWQRLYDRVQKIQEKLADPKGIFRDSLIENAQEICSLLPRLNFANDPQLEQMRQEVEGALLQNPDALRTSPTLRENTADKAKQIMDKMSVFMGGIQ